MPTIDDNGFYVYESHAILRYLAAKFSTEDHWFPKDLKKRTKVEMYLDWHHLNIRRGAASLVFFTVFKSSPMKMNFDDDEQREEVLKILKKSLKFIEKSVLNSHKFIGDLNEPSIADLSLYGELSQLSLVNYDLTPFKNIKIWMKKMEKLPNHAEIHSVLKKVAEKRSKL
jgi:glutathione S-transferase